MTSVEKPPGTIKTVPEDFIVMEDGRKPIKETRLSGLLSNNWYTKFLFTKMGVESERGLRHVADELGVERGLVSVQGRKDACAVTTQYVVVQGAFRPCFAHSNMWLWQLGPTSNRLKLGGHEANHFDIVVRTDVSTKPVAQAMFPNVFGPQRFGDLNPAVGKWLLEGDFAAAVELLRGSYNWSRLAVIMREQSCTATEALLQPEFRVDLRFLLQQWQSYLFNQLALETTEAQLPLWTIENNWLYSKWWNPYDLDAEMCYLLHAEGKAPIMRPVWVQAENHQVDPHPLGWRHRFKLRPGSFATVFLGSMYDLKDASRERWPSKRQITAA